MVMSAIDTISPTPGPVPDLPDPVLRLEELRTTFRSRTLTVEAVRGVDLELRAGEITVLLGESGSGKSVTARSILRLYGRRTAIEGSILLGDQDLLSLGPDEMADVRGARIAMVPQDPSAALDPLRRIESQIIEVLRRHGMVADKKEGAVRVRELLAEVGIPDPERVARSYPHELSGGMRQRVVIAIAVSCRPQVLIADEPTTALDVTVQAQILELFRSLTDSLGTAVLMVTHDVGVAAEVADRIGVMYAGLIVEFGRAGEVLDQPRHPYTSALLRSVPTPETERGALLQISGQPPVSGDIPPGCAFSPRCPSAEASCSVEVPELVTVGLGRMAACPVVNPAGDPVTLPEEDR